MERVELTRLEVIEIVDALLDRHDAYLQEDESFDLSGHYSKVEAHVKMILKNEDESFYYPVEARLTLNENENVEGKEALYLVLDFLDYYFSRYVQEGRELFLPIDWEAFEFEEVELWARGQIFNRKLEQLADRWLSGDLTDDERASLEGSGKRK